MKNNKTTYTFETEISQLLDLVINSLYSNKEIFLRELISNSSDAIAKLEFQALTNEKLYEGDSDLKVYIDVDKKNNIISIKDNGIGMSKDEIIENIGTIANSGTKKFLNILKKDKNTIDDKMIGQFGVGFYSSFMVADKVELISKKAGKKDAYKWVSNGKGEYTLEKISHKDRGTIINLFLKKEAKDFLESYKIRSIITKYSNHITIPIMMLKEQEKDSKDIVEYEAINQATAFWQQDKKNLKAKDYEEFYKQLTYDYENPLLYLHNKVEGKLEYTSLLYIPKKAPYDMWEPKRKESIKLYVKRVFIMEDTENLIPLYLRFVKGIVDSKDLPLNVSREILQNEDIIKKIKAANTKRVLNELEKLAKNKPEEYNKFWQEFGVVIKEGVVMDNANKDKILSLVLFSTTISNKKENSVSLDDYINRMQKDQKHIYYISGENYASCISSPQLEVFKEKGVEVLLLSDRIDEWLINHVNEYQGKTLKSVTKSDLEEIEDTNKDKKEKQEKDFENLLKKISDTLGEKIQKVQLTQRLSNSPSCLITDKDDMSGNLQRIMKSLGQAVPENKPILGINAKHKLILKLNKNYDEKLALLLYEQAIISDGGQIENTANFIKRINDLIS